MIEKALIKAINRKLPKSIHHQSMTFGSMSMNGTPDQYYDGPSRDLWVEYKMLKSMPRSGLVGGVDAKKQGCYSPLQFDWMERRYIHARSLLPVPNVIGIVGLPNRTVVVQTTPTEWREGSSISKAISLEEVITCITVFCSQSSDLLVRPW